MWPSHLEVLFGGLKNLNTAYFPSGSRPFGKLIFATCSVQIIIFLGVSVFHEVIDLGGEPITGPEYFGSGRVTEFKYGKFLTQGIRKQNGE